MQTPLNRVGHRPRKGMTMHVLKYFAIAGAASLAWMPTLALSQQPSDDMRYKANCRDLLQEMRQELRDLDVGQQLNSRIDNLIQQARQASSDEQCVRTLRQANGLVNSEIGERPLDDDRFRQALIDARSGQQALRSARSGQQAQRDMRSGQQTTQRRGAEVRASTSDSDAARIAVTYTSELIGRSVRDNEGNEAGELEYMVIDTQNSDIRFAVVSSGGFLDIGDELIAVPWEQIQVRTWGATSEPRLQLAFGLDKLRQGQRLTQDRLDQLASPTYQTDLVSFYLPVQRMGEGRTQRRTGAPADVDEGQRQSATQPGTEGDQSQRKGGEQGIDQGRQTTRTQDAQRRQAARSSGQQDGQNANQLMLVGRELITTLVTSPLRTSSQVKGATVETSDGSEAGEIDRLVVDVERGKVAYALVAKGGFLGIGEEWRAVPLAALKLSGQDTYALNQSQSNLETMPKLTRDELPSRIRQGDLKRLYQAYNVDPYWQGRSRSDRAQSEQQDSRR
jgi:sporulation protein YlmC with PRC-barrel domain